MKQKNVLKKVAVTGPSAKQGNVVFLILAVVALLLFAAVLYMQFSEISYYKDWSL